MVQLCMAFTTLRVAPCGLLQVRLLERRVTALSAQLASEEGYGAKYRRDALQGDSLDFS